MSLFRLTNPDPDLLVRLIVAARDKVFRHGLATVNLGIPAADTVLAVLRKRLRTMDHATRLYAAHYPELPRRTLAPSFPICQGEGLM